MRGTSRLGMLMGLAAVACQRPSPSTTPVRSPTGLAASTAGSVDVEGQAFVHAKGTGPTADEAYEAGVTQLAAVLLGDAAWLKLKPVAVHDRLRDPVDVAPVDDGFEVTVGLSRARAAEVMSAFEVTDPRIEAPERWQDALYAFVYAHAAATICERRRALFDSQCEPGDTADADAGLRELATGMTLAPVHVGGVPVDAGGRALRSPGVYVMWHGVPAAGVPLVASVPGHGEPVAARTDERGRASFELQREGWDEPLRVAIDTAALLGPLAAKWPEVRVEVTKRPTDLRRWGVLVTEDGRRLDDDAGFVKSLVGALQSRGLQQPVSIGAGQAKPVLAARTAGRSDAVVGLADAMGGRLDVLLMIDVRTAFANRMGGSRVWYEAEATVAAHDAWTGRQLTHMEVSATAAGVGDTRAEAAAERELAQKVAERLLADESIPKPALRARPNVISEDLRGQLHRARHRRRHPPVLETVYFDHKPIVCTIADPG